MDHQYDSMGRAGSTAGRGIRRQTKKSYESRSGSWVLGSLNSVSTSSWTLPGVVSHLVVLHDVSPRSESLRYGS